MVKKWYGWQETLHYKIDNMFSKGTPITILWLGIISFNHRSISISLYRIFSTLSRWLIHTYVF